MAKKFDAVIIGGGHNGLVCAFYLARAGMKVGIFEARDVIGGAAVTEEFAPGFRNSTASYTVSLLQPKVIQDMGLAAQGYRVIERPISNFLPLSEEPGDYLLSGGDAIDTAKEFARQSQADADALAGYEAMLERVAGVLRDLALEIPPKANGGIGAALDMLCQSKRLRAMPIAAQREVLAVFTRSAREILDDWFESEAVKAAFGFDATVGHYGSPDDPGSAYVLLHHVFGEVNGKKGRWGHVPGGMCTITRLMAEAAQELGVEIATGCPVVRVLTENGRASGIVFGDGAEVRADHVIANCGPKPLFGQLVPEAEVPQDFVQAMKGYRAGSGSLRMNVALSRLPEFTCLPGRGDHLKAGIVMAPSLNYMDEAYRAARRDGFSAAPIVEMLIPSLVDDTLAPEGQHVASLFCQHVDPDLPAEREAEAVEAAFDVVERVAPGFRRLILHKQVHTPRALEAKFNLARGDIFHGRMSLEQLWAARPTLGAGSYRMPVQGLWLCGSGAHPGGGVTGAPGHNCAHAILRDRKWWRR